MADARQKTLLLQYRNQRHRSCAQLTSPMIRSSLAHTVASQPQAASSSQAQLPSLRRALLELPINTVPSSPWVGACIQPSRRSRALASSRRPSPSRGGGGGWGEDLKRDVRGDVRGFHTGAYAAFTRGCTRGCTRGSHLLLQPVGQVFDHLPALPPPLGPLVAVLVLRMVVGGQTEKGWRHWEAAKFTARRV